MSLDRAAFVWSSRWGVSTPPTVALSVALVPFQTSRCYRCGRFRRDRRVPRHICPVAMRKVRR